MNENKTLDALFGQHGDITKVVYTMQDGSEWSIEGESLEVWKDTIASSESIAFVHGMNVKQGLKEIIVTRIK